MVIIKIYVFTTIKNLSVLPLYNLIYSTNLFESKCVLFRIRLRDFRFPDSGKSSLRQGPWYRVLRLVFYKNSEFLAADYAALIVNVGSLPSPSPLF